mmetsp:Transcript_23432/g.59682  ORF Transcript_23432/g.59682 Transcript_23432/m.59682 type:complete len:81 (+) Transcript_23432:62-304(+)
MFICAFVCIRACVSKVRIVQKSISISSDDPYALLAAVHPGFIEGSGAAAAGSGDDFFSEGESFDVDLPCMLPPPMTPFIE